MFRKLITHKLSHLMKDELVKRTNILPGNSWVLATSPVRWKYKAANESNDDKTKLPQTMSTRYEPFSEESAPVILDIEEERRKVDESTVKTLYDPFEGINIKRGVTGVFDIEDLVEILRREKAMNIFVVKIPPVYCYANYMVIVTGKSSRHMTALSEFIRKVYKMKMNPGEEIPVLEGKTSNEWKAIDLNNIVLHIFSESARKQYDLETLWSVGKEFDSLSNIDDVFSQTMVTDYSKLLEDLVPDTPSNEITELENK